MNTFIIRDEDYSSTSIYGVCKTKLSKNKVQTLIYNYKKSKPGDYDEDGMREVLEANGVVFISWENVRF